MAVKDEWSALGEGERERGSRERTTVEILLVGQHEKQTVAHFPVVDDAVEFGPGLVNAGAVGGINDEDEPLSSYKEKHVSVTPFCLENRIVSVDVGWTEDAPL